MRLPFPSEDLHSLLEAIVESSEDAIFSKTLGGLVLSWNSGAERLYGYNAHEMVGQSISILVPEDRRPELAAIMRRLGEGQRVAPFETVRRRKDGRPVDVSVTISPLRDATGKIIGASTIARDITKHKQAEERQRLLDEVSRLFASSLDCQITLKEITQLVVPSWADYCRIAIVDEHHQIKDIVVHHSDSEKVALVRALYESSKDRPEITCGVETLLQSGKPELLSIVSQDVLETAGTHPDLLHIVQELGLKSYMGVSLIARGRTIGAIAFSSVHPHRKYSEDDLSFAQEFARRIALALDNTRLYEEAQEEIRVRKQVEAALRESEAHKGAVFETALDAILTMDHLGRIVALNPAAEKTFGYTRQEVVGRTMAELIIPASLREGHRRGLAHYLATGEGPVMDRRIETVALRRDGSEFPIELAITRVPTEGDPFFTGTIRDITERKQAEERQRVLQEHILAMVTTDPVTALPNHRAMIALLDQELERAQRYQRCFSLLFLDLDHFKAFNDGYGHAAGDALLCAFVGLVQSRLRGLDTLGRWGGEEFVVLVPELEGDEALALAEGVRAAVAASIFPVAGGTHLTCSIGLASYPLHAQEREVLLSAADQAMYGAKHFGRNQVRVAHDPAVHAIFNVSQPEGGREEAALVGVVEALVALVEARDHLTGQHSHQVAALALQLALALGWLASEAQMLARAGQLHDVGKVAIPETILQKPGPLTAQEWDIIRTHPVVGADVVSHIPALRPLAPIIRAHHERWDGQGYPDQLAGEAIPLGARILTVADAYLTMIVDRPYRPACTSAAALAELRRCAGSQFDTQVVEALVRHLREPEEGGG
jgi:diguanylate cyclase (GGDEF)-like protein/PAS domain S-box-containing protein/putative nucleotidyltransferase with HDIG domain